MKRSKVHATTQSTQHIGSSLPSRPDGAVVWVICSDTASQDSCRILEQSPQAADSQVSFLTTYPSSWTSASTTGKITTPQTPHDIDQFLSHWAPDLVIWYGERINTKLLFTLKAHGLAPIWITHGTQPLYRTLWPKRLVQIIGAFSQIFTHDQIAMQRLLKRGAAAETTQVLGPLQNVQRAVHFDTSERKALAQACKQRPLWLAANFQIEDIPIIAKAQRLTNRVSHRLLCVAAAPEQLCLDHAQTLFETQGLHVAQYRPEQGKPAHIYDTTQVLLTRGDEQLGLWYSLCPISYWGGSLTSGVARPPCEAPACGSALIAGPNSAPYQEGYAQLTETNACVEVKTAQDLSHAVEHLLAPHTCADLISRAWTSTTQTPDTLSTLHNYIRRAIT